MEGWALGASVQVSAHGMVQTLLARRASGASAGMPKGEAVSFGAADAGPSVGIFELDRVCWTTTPRLIPALFGYWRRGISSADDFEALRVYAREIGALLGATAGAVAFGYARPSEFVGRCGQMLSPDLVLAVGVSGAIQHMSGVSHGAHWLVINPILRPQRSSV